MNNTKLTPNQSKALLRFIDWLKDSQAYDANKTCIQRVAVDIVTNCDGGYCEDSAFIVDTLEFREAPAYFADLIASASISEVRRWAADDNAWTFCLSSAVDDYLREEYFQFV